MKYINNDYNSINNFLEKYVRRKYKMMLTVVKGMGIISGIFLFWYFNNMILFYSEIFLFLRIKTIGFCSYMYIQIIFIYNNHKMNSEYCHNFPRLAAVKKVITVFKSIFKYKTVCGRLKMRQVFSA